MGGGPDTYASSCASLTTWTPAGSPSPSQRRTTCRQWCSCGPCCSSRWPATAVPLVQPRPVTGVGRTLPRVSSPSSSPRPITGMPWPRTPGTGRRVGARHPGARHTRARFPYGAHGPAAQRRRRSIGARRWPGDPALPRPARVAVQPRRRGRGPACLRNVRESVPTAGLHRPCPDPTTAPGPTGGICDVCRAGLSPRPLRRLGLVHPCSARGSGWVLALQRVDPHAP